MLADIALVALLFSAPGTPQPHPAGGALIRDLPVAPTRFLDAYRITPAVADGGLIP